MPKLGVVSDVHWRAERATAIRTELEGVVDRFDAADVERVVVLGDLLEDARTPEQDRRHVRALRETLEAGGFDVTYLLGNHDTENLDAADHRELLGQESYGRFEVAGRDAIYLNSACLPGAAGRVTSEQLSFLERTAATVENALLFVHHPVCYLDLSENAWFAEHPERAICTNKAEINSILDDHDSVAACFSGHVHANRHVRYRGRDHVVVDAFSKARPDSTAPAGTYGLLTIDDGIAVRVLAGDVELLSVTIP